MTQYMKGREKQRHQGENIQNSHQKMKSAQNFLSLLPTSVDITVIQEALVTLIRILYTCEALTPLTLKFSLWLEIITTGPQIPFI